MTDNVSVSKYSNVSLTTSKVCRLCGSKDGPFLNIFGPGMDLAKKIEDLLLILVNEWDDLPHKICFRCSAKVADFHEFLEKCVKTQENFSKMLGKDFNYKRDKSKKLINDWEAKLNKNKLSNDEYCDELVKKALESVASLTFEKSSEFQNFGVESRLTRRKCSTTKYSETLNRNNEMLKKPIIKLSRIDSRNFPGVERRNGKFFIVDVTKNTASFKDNKIEENKNVEVSPNKNGNQPNLINRFESIQESLKKYKTEVKKKFGESASDSAAKVEMEPKPEAETVIHKEQQSLDKVSENFTIVKVAGVGPVYTCKFCDHLILDKHRMYTHKCLVWRSTKENPPRADHSQSNVNKNIPETLTANNVASHDENNIKKKKEVLLPTCAATPVTTPVSQRKRRSESSVTSRSDEQIKQIKVNTPTSTMLPSADSSDPAEIVQQVPNKLQITPDKPSFNVADIGNTPSAEFLSKSFYLVHMGNNSYSLQTTPQLEINPPFNNNPVNTSSISENSILPDSSKLVKTSVPAIKAKKKAISSVTNKKTRNATNHRISTKNHTSHKKKKLKVLHSEENTAKVDAPRAPYPIGLLCRNNSNGSTHINDQTSAENIVDFVSKSKHDRNEFPQYTILPPKTPGKIVIATVPSMKNINSSQKCISEKSKKQHRKQIFKVTPDTIPKIPVLDTPPPVQSEHFFTYVDLDPMLKPSYVLPTQTLFQEPQLSTTDVSIIGSSSVSHKVSSTESKSETEKDDPILKYTCSICDLEFSREKKLFAHVKSHYEGFYNDNDD